jgi:hypothetical protein
MPGGKRASEIYRTIFRARPEMEPAGLWHPRQIIDIACFSTLHPTFRETIAMAKEPGRTHTTSSVDTGAPLPATTPKKRSKWKITAVLFLFVLPLAAFALWVTIALTFSYASGERAGFVQKLSNKGWVCKTWEGELALANGPNVMPEIFRFTVRDDQVATVINNSLGRQVKLSYEQHKGVPTKCFGETEYFVTNAEVIGPGAPASVGATVPAPAVAPATLPATTTPPTVAPSPAPAATPTPAPAKTP